MKVITILLIAAFGTTLVSTQAVENGDKRLIQTNDALPAEWMTEDEIFNLIQQGQGFIDVTDFDFLAPRPSKASTKAIPTSVRFQEAVRSACNSVKNQRIIDFVQTFSNYHTRFYNTETGRTSQLFLYGEVDAAVRKYESESYKNTNEYDHGYPQRSIIAKLDGNDPQYRNEIVIIGAHLDSANLMGGSERAPGADDNASGSAVVLEALRAIADTGILFKRSLEFHWYAAEEIGLRGSMEISDEYRRTNKSVLAMLNLDVLGYHAENIEDIAIFTDNTDPELTLFLRLLTDEYLQYGRRDRVCDYGCSDHASWDRNGFAAGFVSEYVWHPQMHTEQDNIQNMNFTQVNEFVKLALAFVVELAEPLDSK